MISPFSIFAHQSGFDPFIFGANVTIVLGGLGMAGLITYLKRWKWLWKEWLTTLDPKKIGVMYIIVALIMLLRGAADALMIRTQQATSVGSHSGILPADHFQSWRA